VASTLSPTPTADDAPSPWARGTARRRRRARIRAVAILAAVVSVAGAAWSLGAGDVRAVSVDEVAAPSGPALPSAPAVLRPVQGVYRYVGSGTDRLDLPPKVQPQGPEMAATVTHRPDGCWTFRLEMSTSHWQSWDYCPRDGGLDEVGGTSFQTWDFGVFVQEVDLRFDCDAPTVRAGQVAGDVWPQRCDATNADTGAVSTSEGPATFVGTETVAVGDESVRAHHYRRERIATGATTGGEVSDVWFSAVDGLPLRNVRRITATTAGPIGPVTYTEDARFEATSPDPVR